MPHHASKAKKTGGTSIVDLVLQDHVTVKDLYKEIQSAGDHDAEKQYEKMCWEIALHAVAEELILYPLQESMDEEGKQNAEESKADHEKTKQALKELEGKTLQEEGVREKVDAMMKDLIEHMDKEETEDLVKLKELGEEKLLAAGLDFEQVKSLIPDVAPSNVAHSEKETDRSESDGHFKSPMALLLTSKDKLQAILGKHGKSESVSVNKDKEHGHQAGDHHGNSGAGRNGGEHEKAQKKDKNGDDNGHEKGDDAAGHVVVDEESHEKALADSIRADVDKYPSGLAPSKRNTEGEHPDATSPKKTAHE